MKPLLTTAAIAVLGSVGAVGADVQQFNPRVLPDQVQMIANERVDVKQVGNVVEAQMPWKGEQGLKVKYDMGEPTALERIKDKRNKEIVTETVDFGDGGFKIDILLNEKPATNTFCYTVEGAENYDFFYQPPLTQEEIDEGAERPDDIVGSYAVYHKSFKNQRNELLTLQEKRSLSGEEIADMVEGGLITSIETDGEPDYAWTGINYATGKVMHIPRPEVWEVDNKASTTEWATLSYNEPNLCVTVDQDYLDKANYPVRVDPTFGYTSIGASTQNLRDDWQGSVFAGVTGTIDSITAYIDPLDFDPDGEFAFGIYRDSDGVLVDNSSNISLSAGFAWHTLNQTGASITSQDYVLIVGNSSDFYLDDWQIKYDTDTGVGRYKFNTYTPFPDPITFSTGDQKCSIYATYTAGGGEEEVTTTVNTTVSGNGTISGNATIGITE